jgi:hypothetical protein
MTEMALICLGILWEGKKAYFKEDSSVEFLMGVEALP